MTHECKHEADFGRMAETIERMDKEIFGNGKKGLSHTVTELSVEVKSLKDTAEQLRTAVAGLIKFESEQRGYEKKSTKNLKTWSVVIAFIGLIIAGIVGFAGMKNEQEVVRESVQEIRDIIYQPKFRGAIEEIND